jgi:hypothetical protein
VPTAKISKPLSLNERSSDEFWSKRSCSILRYYSYIYWSGETKKHLESIQCWLSCFSVEIWNVDLTDWFILAIGVSRLQFNVYLKLISSAILLMTWPLRTFYRPHFSTACWLPNLLFCSANQVLHIPLATYCLAYIRLPKLPTHSPWRWKLKCLHKCL